MDNKTTDKILDRITIVVISGMRLVAFVVVVDIIADKLDIILDIVYYVFFIIIVLVIYLFIKLLMDKKNE